MAILYRKKIILPNQKPRRSYPNEACFVGYLSCKVPGTGLEPVREVISSVFKTDASTGFAILAADWWNKLT